MTVNNVNALLTYTSSQIEQTGMKQDEIAKDSFTQVMAKANDTMNNLKAELAGNAGNATVSSKIAEPAAADKKEAPVQNAERRVTSDSGKAEDTAQQNNDNKVVKDTGTDVETEQDTEEVEKAGEKLVQDIAEEMDVTPEEVEAAMAVLGLTIPQLFDVDNLKQLLLTISGSDDELSLVTNETLYDNLQQLFTVVEKSLVDLREELGMSEEELDALLERMISDNREADMQDDVPAQEMPETDQEGQEGLEGLKDYTVTVQRDGETVRMKVTVDDASGDKSVQEEVTDTPKEVLTVHKTRERETFADSGREEGNAAGSAFMQTSDSPMEVIETPEPVEAGYQSTQTQEIMDQIMDYMKINLKADVQEMELQLHPASLGTVNVQIASKDGAITAQFTTQNETVRAVIETQMIQLKNQFEEQGLKVDAVEVTVANHEYGQQFSQENGNPEQKQSKSAKNTRRINLDEIDEEADIEQMEESERIAVEMMQANGGSLDYTV